MNESSRLAGRWLRDLLTLLLVGLAVHLILSNSNFGAQGKPWMADRE